MPGRGELVGEGQADAGGGAGDQGEGAGHVAQHSWAVVGTATRLGHDGPVSASKTRVLAVANQKGGVAKTTTVASLGAALAELGHRVLLVDLDPQACLTFSLGIDPEDLELSVHHVLTKGLDATEVIIATDDGVDLLPATIELARAESDLLTRTGREHVVKMALEDLEYDWVLLDCPPSLGVLTVAALTAAQGVLIPLQCETLSHRGVGQLLDTVHDVRRFTNRKLEVWGVLPTLYDGRTNHARAVLENISETYQLDVIEPPIPKSIRFAEAPAAGRSILGTTQVTTGAPTPTAPSRPASPSAAASRSSMTVMGRLRDGARRAVGPPPLQAPRRGRWRARGDARRGARRHGDPALRAGHRRRGGRRSRAGSNVQPDAKPAAAEPGDAVPSAGARGEQATDKVLTPTLPANSGTGRRIVFAMGEPAGLARAAAVATPYVAPTSSRAASPTTCTRAPTRSTPSRCTRSASTTPGRCSTWSASPRATTRRSASTTSRCSTTRPVQARDDLGTPQSHGCIRQWRPDARALWDFAPVGTQVVVVA